MKRLLEVVTEDGERYDICETAPGMFKTVRADGMLSIPASKVTMALVRMVLEARQQVTNHPALEDCRKAQIDELTTSLVWVHAQIDETKTADQLVNLRRREKELIAMIDNFGPR